MITQYPEEFKASIIARMLPPENTNVPELARDTGIPKDTLYTWRLKYRNSQGPTAGDHMCVTLFLMSPTNKGERILFFCILAFFCEIHDFCRYVGFFAAHLTFYMGLFSAIPQGWKHLLR